MANIITRSVATSNTMTTPTPTAAASSATVVNSTTTRICIKNLHPSFDETKLKSHLQNAQPNLHITDCKLLKTADGKSRKIAFVGLQTASQAESAVSYFDKSFAGTARLSVSFAFSKKKNQQKLSSSSASTSEYRPWSKHSEGSSRYAKLHQGREQQHDEEVDTKNNKSNLGVKGDENTVDEQSKEANRKRDEFLSAMGISTSSKQGGQISKSKFWANDDANVEPTEEQHVKQEEDDDDIANESDTDSQHSNSSSSVDSDSDDENIMMDSGKDDRNKNTSSDLDFLRSKQVKAEILSDESDEEAENDESDCESSSSCDSDDSSSESDASSKDELDEEKVESGNDVLLQQSGASAAPDYMGDKKAPVHSASSNTLFDRLFVRNLPFTTTEEDLYDKFTEFGHVTAVHIPVDDSKRNKGYAFINFEHSKDAKHAMETLDGEDFQGRLIHILPARPSADQSNDVDESNLTYKERQALARQKEAEKSSTGWSASFLRGDAVVDNLSERLGVSKGDLLNVKDGISSGNAAVRLALGETHIISENIAFFESHGVDVTVLDSKSSRNGNNAPKRSKTMILVKNLPFDTSLEDLTKVFHGIGGDVPQKILLPPSKTAALVEYGHATDARRAFRNLAYKKFKHVPLYLEWAPMMAKDDKEPLNIDPPKQGGSDTGMESGLAGDDPTMETADIGGSQTLYVKNLNFTTTELGLEKAFVQAGFQPRAVKIPTKTAPLSKVVASSSAESIDKNSNRQLSMGFGFVELSAEQVALNALKAMQGRVVDGHALEIKLSTKTLSAKSTPATDKSSKNTKIIVRNVPFEASRTELLQLFGSFGQLKKVRLPKKFDGSHRGFAFCEFLTSKEAQNAMTTLSRTHLYGRHLVLEWAEASNEDGQVDVDAIREKAKRDAMRAGLGGSEKKRKHLKF